MGCGQEWLGSGGERWRSGGAPGGCRKPSKATKQTAAGSHRCAKCTQQKPQSDPPHTPTQTHVGETLRFTEAARTPHNPTHTHSHTRGVSGTRTPQTTQHRLTAPGHLQPDKGTHKCTDACRAQLRSPGPPTCDCTQSYRHMDTRVHLKTTHRPQHNVDPGLQPPPHPVPVKAQTQRHTGSHMETDDKTHPTHPQGSAHIHAQHTYSISVPPSPHADADALPIT